MTKYIFVTGGVVSGLGKGIVMASLGRLLKCRGFKVIAQKLDPYINVDPGTMSPYQHGEVFVTNDGAETDLDLGHYERFIDENLNKYSNLTTGKVFFNVLNKEREGKYLGETVQIIPHVTNEIKDFIYAVNKDNADVVLTEIGGTIGDIESQPFLEAIRQVSRDKGRENCLYIHVTLVPVIDSSGEQKSKPTQHSVKELRALGINPDIIVTRCDSPLDETTKHKISLFCDVKPDCVIESLTVKTIYQAPIMFEKNNFSQIVCRELNLPQNKLDLTKWQSMLVRIDNLKEEVNIALVGKYVKMFDAYMSIAEALKHGGYNCAKVNIIWVESETLTLDNIDKILSNVDGIIVPGGFGNRGIEGMILACNYARTHNVPYLGICLGMQVAVIEYARNVCNMANANSTEFDENTNFNVIDFMPDQKGNRIMGGTMRLGAYPCEVTKDTLLHQIYDANLISERHRHRYEVNNIFLPQLLDNGLTVSGVSPNHNLVEAIELNNHPFFLGVQFHPEFTSRPDLPNPIFTKFIEKSLEYKNTKE